MTYLKVHINGKNVSRNVRSDTHKLVIAQPSPVSLALYVFSSLVASEHCPYHRHSTNNQTYFIVSQCVLDLWPRSGHTWSKQRFIWNQGVEQTSRIQCRWFQGPCEGLRGRNGYFSGSFMWFLVLKTIVRVTYLDYMYCLISYQVFMHHGKVFGRGCWSDKCTNFDTKLNETRREQFMAYVADSLLLLCLFVLQPVID